MGKVLKNPKSEGFMNIIFPLVIMVLLLLFCLGVGEERSRV